MPSSWAALAARAVRPFALVIVLVVGLAALKCCERAYAPVSPAFARELYAEQYKDMPPNVRQWFKRQKNPTTGLLCCNEADGVAVEEDIRSGHYWTKGGPFSDWVIVPDDTVLSEGNPNGSPVLWWYMESGTTKIRCFAPGGGV